MTIIPVMQIQLAAIVLMYSVLAFSFIDGFYLSRKIKKEVAKRFGSENLKGVGMYGWLRSTQIRRLRAPLPRVTRGTKL
jgi:hypothetical protein